MHLWIVFVIFCLAHANPVTNPSLSELIFTGRTTAMPAWRRIVTPGSPVNPYYVVPLLSQGNYIPLLEGSYGSFTQSQTEKFRVFGSLDGMGVEKVGNFWYVYGNHELEETEVGIDGFVGARVSLFVFTEDWRVFGGRNLIDRKTSAVTGDNITDIVMGSLCAASLNVGGFYGGSIFFTNEEGEGSFCSWAVYVETGEAVRIEAAGVLAHENTVPASAYLPTKNNAAKKTVLLTTADNGAEGFLYMYVGNQTVEDPNGFVSGDLYVMRVSTYDHETFSSSGAVAVTWTPVPKDLVYNLSTLNLDGATALFTWTNEAGSGRATRFRKMEDFDEDHAQNPGSFYLTTTGAVACINSSLTDIITVEQCGAELNFDPLGCDNAFGRIYRLNISNTDPLVGSTIELIVQGSNTTGGCFDNVVVTSDGEVWIMEDADTSGPCRPLIVDAQQRTARIWKLDPKSKVMTPVLEIDATSYAPNYILGAGSITQSGIVEIPSSDANPVFLAALQGVYFPIDEPNGIYDYMTQLAILVPVAVNPSEPSFTANDDWGQVYAPIDNGVGTFFPSFWLLVLSVLSALYIK